MPVPYSFQTTEQPLSLQSAQQLVDRWIRDIGVSYFSELTNLAQLMEEVGELARIISRRFGDQSFKESDREVSLSAEMADVLFVLICLANQTGVDLTEALRRNLESKTIRDTERHRNNPKLKPMNNDRLEADVAANVKRRE
jgi:NTP pyrophosphatase (non-canonical NTP hydrolase)